MICGASVPPEPVLMMWYSAAVGEVSPSGCEEFIVSRILERVKPSGFAEAAATKEEVNISVWSPSIAKMLRTFRFSL